jgi:hypothetical protein
MILLYPILGFLSRHLGKVLQFVTEQTISEMLEASVDYLQELLGEKQIE